MPLFGAHMSVAGGLHKAVAASASLGCGTVQIFTKNANQWAGKPLAEDEIRTFRKAIKEAKLKYPTAHDSYLINLATPDDALYRKSIDAFAHELERAEALGLSYLVTHPGAHTGSGVDAGIARVVAALDQVHARCSGFQVRVLVETTAGQGTCLGAKFEEIAAVLDRVKDPARLGVCLDTCHVFAAGYAITRQPDYAATFEQFDDRIGLSRLKLFHINDSEKPLGSRVDRHAALGRGAIGLDAFRRLVTDARFRARPMILETPKEDADGTEMDPVNLGTLREILAAGPPAPAAGRD
ncbi:MAG: nfo 2 [Gemmataceae bacterium]|nr:nfo 2 [Gemmataceae bacterium]